MCVQVWNPAFDVTPASLITGIITEQGIIQQRDGAIDVNSFLREHGLLEAEESRDNGDPLSSSPNSHCVFSGRCHSGPLLSVRMHWESRLCDGA